MRRSDLTQTEYFQYYKQYTDLVDDVPLLDALEHGWESTAYFFATLPEEKLDYRYTEGKWTPKDILLHLVDTERVFCYRALYFARNENSDIKGFDENIFAANANANNRTVDDLLNEFASVRAATINFFKGCSEGGLLQTGKANNNILSVRSCAFIICGHEIHHCNVIKERYLD